MSAQGRVSLRGVRKIFGKFVALDGIDLDIEPVEFFALLGPSGSGKTTTLRIIAGLDTPDEGTISVDGVDVTFAPPHDRDVAMVFQNYALYPHMSVHGNIAFPLKMARVASEAIDDLVTAAAANVHIDHLLHRYRLLSPSMCHWPRHDSLSKRPGNTMNQFFLHIHRTLPIYQRIPQG